MPGESDHRAGDVRCRRVRGEWTVCLAGRRIHAGSDLVWILPKGHVEEGEQMEDTALREKLNAAIKKVRESGDYDKITKKYFNFDIYGG
jgi:ADP-ribose pyrophosphatase YjhB (NUDIX family)